MRKRAESTPTPGVKTTSPTSQQVIEEDQIKILNANLSQILDDLAEVRSQNEALMAKHVEFETKVEELSTQIEEAVFRMDYPELSEN